MKVCNKSKIWLIQDFTLKFKKEEGLDKHKKKRKKQKAKEFKLARHKSEDEIMGNTYYGFCPSSMQINSYTLQFFLHVMRKTRHRKYI